MDWGSLRTHKKGSKDFLKENVYTSYTKDILQAKLRKSTQINNKAIDLCKRSEGGRIIAVV